MALTEHNRVTLHWVSGQQDNPGPSSKREISQQACQTETHMRYWLEGLTGTYTVRYVHWGSINCKNRRTYAIEQNERDGSGPTNGALNKHLHTIGVKNETGRKTFQKVRRILDFHIQRGLFKWTKHWHS